MTDRGAAARVSGPVRVVGSGLLGTSVGLGLRALGVEVILDDASPLAGRLAREYGAGRAARADDAPSLVVVAVPPDVTGSVVAAELERHPSAIVTDVASVKSAILEELRAAGAEVARYLGGHPMAGRERGGAVSARADLFRGRPWILARHDDLDPRAAGLVEALTLDLGATPVALGVEEHDRAVALVSHAPQVVASLLAARLLEGTDAALGLSGQGLRDSTRIAASDPALWVQILVANARPVAEVLRPLRDGLDGVIAALESIEGPTARRALLEAMAAGNDGVARIPGKHGSSKRYTTLTVRVEDRPGELARLLTEIGEEGVNMEDLRLEHSPEAQVGFAEVAVLPAAAAPLAEALAARGWMLLEADR